MHHHLSSIFTIILFICLINLSANAQEIEIVGNENPIKLPKGTYYFDSYEYGRYSESILITDNTITREETNSHNETYKNTYTVTHSFGVTKDLFFLFTENEEEGYNKTLFMLVLQLREDGINLNKSFFYESTKTEYYELVDALKELKGDARKEEFFQKKSVTLYQYYPLEKYEALKNLPTITNSQLPKVSKKLIEQLFRNDNAYYEYLYNKQKNYYPTRALDLQIFNFMINNGFQPFISTRALFEYETGTDQYLDKKEEKRMESRSSIMVFFDKIGSAFDLLATLALVWLALALFFRYKNLSKQKDIEQNQTSANQNRILLPRLLKPFLTIIAIAGFSVIGGHLGSKIGWGLAQAVTPNNDGGLADIFMAGVGLLAGAGGGLAFGIWCTIKLNKTIYYTPRRSPPKP